eukprot:TRINITY_DN7622_c0_g1_i2.p1 TRINITY_DN7622_c0_g1~~TRINITY_DN7622_c0_g1_i2.p1  ORF type:complete len:1664 (+),score=322.02 TRINITY_DN7622_c0_g1_i2:46-5037(+)
MSTLEELSLLSGVRLQNVTSVSEIVLKKKGISKVPHALSFLTRLSSLDLSSNQIEEIPAFFSILSNLQVLNLSKNKISTPPNELFGLTQLQSIDLSHNQIDEVDVRWSQFSCLRHVYLSGNPILCLPGSLMELTNLEKLHVSRCQISVIPESITALTQLKEFNLSLNQMTEFPHAILQLSRLKFLNLIGNKISYLPEELGGMKELENLILTNNPLVDSGWTLIWKCFDFRSKKLDLSHQKLHHIPNQVMMVSGVNLVTLDYNCLTICAEYEQKLQWAKICQDSNSLGSEKERLQYQVSIPPEICQSSLQVSILGNAGVPFILTQSLPKILQSANLKPIEKALLILRIIRNIPNHDPILAMKFEDFAISCIAEEVRTKGVENAVNLRIVKLAVQAECHELLSNSLVYDQVCRIWRNGFSMRGYLTHSKQKVSWFEDGFGHFLLYFSSALYHEVPKLLNSPKAKYAVSFLMYIILLVILVTVTVFANMSYAGNNVLFAEHMRQSYQPPILSSIEDIWQYWLTDFADTIYNGKEPPPSLSTGTNSYLSPFSFHRLFGKISLRQLRSKSYSCYDVTVESYQDNPFFETPPQCVYPYDDTFQETKPYRFGNMTNRYSHKNNFFRTISQYTEIMYPRGGYIQELSENRTEASLQLTELQENGWIDLQTRAVVVEFLIVNDNTQLLSFVSQLHELPAAGGIHSEVKIQILPSIAFNNYFSFYSILHIALAVYGLGFLMHEAWQLKRMGVEYFNDVWNFFDIFMFLLIIVVVSMQSTMNSLYSVIRQEQISDQELYDSYNNIMNLWVIYKIVLGVLLILALLRVMYFFTIFESFGPMQLVVAAMAKDMIRFLGMLFIFFISFSLSYYTIFGSVLLNYSSFPRIMSTLGLYLFGEFNFDEIRAEEPIVAPLLFFLYMLLCGILLVNFLIAILSGTYDEIQSNSEKKYKTLFAETVVSLEYEPPPAPLNFFIPVIWAIARFIGFFLPIEVVMRFLLRIWTPVSSYMVLFFMSGWQDRTLCWHFLWSDSDFDRAFWGPWPLPNVHILSNYVDVIGWKWVTIWFDFSWLAGCYFILYTGQAVRISFSRLMAMCKSRFQARPVARRSTKVTSRRITRMLKPTYTFNDLDDSQLSSPFISLVHEAIHAMRKNLPRFFVRFMWVITFVYWILLYIPRFFLLIYRRLHGRHERTKLDVSTLGGFAVTQCNLIAINNQPMHQLIRSSRPFTQNLFKDYFEVCVVTPGVVAIGLNFEQDSPQANKHSIVEFTSSPSHRDWNLSYDLMTVKESCNQFCGVLGCGVDYIKKTIFFTNGAKYEIFSLKDVDLSQPLYPVILVETAETCIRANFGASCFHIFSPSFVAPQENNWSARFSTLQSSADGVVSAYVDEVYREHNEGPSRYLKSSKPLPVQADCIYFQIDALDWGKSKVLRLGIIPHDPAKHSAFEFPENSIEVIIDLNRLELHIIDHVQGGDFDPLTHALPVNTDPRRLGMALDLSSNTTYIIVDDFIIEEPVMTAVDKIESWFALVLCNSYGQVIVSDWSEFHLIPSILSPHLCVEKDEDSLQMAPLLSRQPKSQQSASTFDLHTSPPNSSIVRRASITKISVTVEDDDSAGVGLAVLSSNQIISNRDSSAPSVSSRSTIENHLNIPIDADTKSKEIVSTNEDGILGDGGDEDDAGL